MAEDDKDDEERSDDIALAPNRIADDHAAVEACFDDDILDKFEIFSYRNAALLLKNSYPAHHAELCGILRQFEITTRLIRSPGQNKSQVAKYFDTLFSNDWREVRLVADLNVQLVPARKKNPPPIDRYTREGFFDGHRIDFLNGKVALDFEWNSKDQTYDRDLYAFAAFYAAGMIDVGILVTRGQDLDTDFFRSLGPVLKKNGDVGTEPTYKKFGASTTWMGKLLYRLNAGRNGGCPILAIGIKQNCITDLP